MEKTEWYPGDVKPAHKGVYETLDIRISGREEIRFQSWNGKFWGAYTRQIVDAEDCADDRSNCRSPQWRGLTEPAS